MLRYHETGSEQAHAAAALPALVGADRVLAAANAAFAGSADALLARCDPTLPAPLGGETDAALGAMEAHYEELKAALLAAGADGRLRLTDMEQSLRRCSALRRAAQQAAKSRQRRSGSDGEP